MDLYKYVVGREVRSQWFQNFVSDESRKCDVAMPLDLLSQDIWLLVILGCVCKAEFLVHSGISSYYRRSFITRFASI